MIRQTDTGKWRDAFFYNLSAAPKLVFIYLYENCNDAGFLDLDYGQMHELMKLEKSKIEKCLIALESRYVKNSDGTKIWIKNFLLHQNKLPLPIKTEEGRRLLHILESNLSAFDSNQFIRDIITDSLKKKGRSITPKETKIFVPPTIEEAQAEVETLWLYYKGKGWKVGKSPMVDWVSAFRGCFIRDKKNKLEKVNFSQNGEKQTRLDKIKAAAQKPIDYNQLG